MLYINKITENAQQSLTLTGIPGVSIDMELRFMPRMRTWLMSLQSPAGEANGIVITALPNMLRAFRHIFPFGICCLTQNGLDPFRVTDFADQSANLYLLDAADVDQLEAEMFT